MIDITDLPQEVQDYIELKEQTDQTFHRFLDHDYSDIWWNKMAERANPEVEHSLIVSISGTQGSGKSMATISMCCFMDPNFSIDNIYFSYNDLVYNRHNLKPNSAILMDEQSQSYGMDSHRVMIILNNIKEQLRKKSIHLFFCAPVLYEESKTSMYTMETIFIDYENQETYAALRTREGHVLGHVRIPYPLKPVDASGQALATKELIDAYQDKKDFHLEKILGNQDQDVFEERAKMVVEHGLFKQAEKLYVTSKGYVPQTTLVQIINKIFPEYNSGVVPGEIAGRIKLNKELSGAWIVPGSASPKKAAKKSKKKK